MWSSAHWAEHGHSSAFIISFSLINSFIDSNLLKWRIEWFCQKTGKTYVCREKTEFNWTVYLHAKEKTQVRFLVILIFALLCLIIQYSIEFLKHLIIDFCLQIINYTRLLILRMIFLYLYTIWFKINLVHMHFISWNFLNIL